MIWNYKHAVMHSNAPQLLFAAAEENAYVSSEYHRPNEDDSIAPFRLKRTQKITYGIRKAKITGAGDHDKMSR